MKFSRRAFLQLAGLGGTAWALRRVQGDAVGPAPIVANPVDSHANLHVLATGRSPSTDQLTKIASMAGLVLELTLSQTPASLSGFDLAIIPAHALTGYIRRGAVRELTVEIGDQDLEQRPYDPLNAFSLPAGQGAIGINARQGGAPTTWAEFFRLAQTVPVHLPPIETFHAALKSLGEPLNTRNYQARVQAHHLLAQVRSVPLAQAQLALGPQILGWQFTIPAEGAELWQDCYCIPTTSTQPDLALAFIRLAAQPQAPAALPTNLEPRSSFGPAA